MNTRCQLRTVRWIAGVVRTHLLREAFRRPRYTIHLVLVILLSTVISWSQSAGPTELQVKAAYLYNFGKFVTWQTDHAPDTLQICLLGKDPFGAVLDSTVAGERIAGRTITVRRLARVQDAGPCSILFISASEEGKLGSVLASTQSLSLLTISDIPHFVEKGGMIGFVKQDDRIRFEVNRKAAEESHLALSSELLKVAVKVFGN